jgi:hypothetical protein
MFFGHIWFSPITAAERFRFDQDTLAFTNMTVFEYHGGVAQLRRESNKERRQRYTRRCFVMCRTAMQFRKFARFEPNDKPLDDAALSARIRRVARIAAWKSELPEELRVVFPGYRNLRQLSKERGWVLQKNIGLGWPTYFRIGNYRMFYNLSRRYQQRTHAVLNQTLANSELFVAYLSDFPRLRINHAVLVYRHRRARPGAHDDHYDTYDPNHPDGPRELVWHEVTQEFSFQKDEEFPGGYTRVYQVYGKPLQ